MEGIKLEKNILLFGYGNHGKFIAKGLMEDGFTVQIVESNETFYLQAMDDGFKNVLKVDMTKDEDLIALNPKNYSRIVCVMDDEHLNVFLTLSLHSLFDEAYLIAISDSLHATQKLYMAGANKVIDLYEVSANKIHNILNRPIATELLEEFVTYKKGIGFKELLIPEGSFLHGLMTDDIEFSEFDVILVGILDEELGNNFNFITAGINHKLDSGDTIVCLGSHKELAKLEMLIKQKEVPKNA